MDAAILTMNSRYECDSTISNQSGYRFYLFPIKNLIWLQDRNITLSAGTINIASKWRKMSLFYELLRLTGNYILNNFKDI